MLLGKELSVYEHFIDRIAIITSNILSMKKRFYIQFQRQISYHYR
ncbi:hypothetical protein APHNP_0600 [Anaplasma phagocytophilum str. ApNP]|uniref:Uncharacterized protein n=1 Tax=Anaplasma phagocytophilum str. ApNP TaxID=1359153 RepID=A0A0F3NH25_ANAPH|nr:hypothetical protein APHNP_0600 [Anaplasma phagocytophilum str. ApNP]